MDSIGDLIVAVEGCQGVLAPVLAVLKRSAERWFTVQRTSEDGDRMRFDAHALHVATAREERRLRARAVREQRDKKAQGACVCACVRAYVRACLCAYVRACVHVCVPVRTCACLCWRECLYVWVQ